MAMRPFVNQVDVAVVGLGPAGASAAAIAAQAGLCGRAVERHETAGKPVPRA
ncbi:MAG: FAD-dependent monooxygenase, partial [Alphaproteobacteria bacterium]|nr:FAD-dependent monooxygenase [Alphaproteobacteria bacterium]